jgi:hypothetical protein
MRRIYQALLRLYPVAYQTRFGEEMMFVFSEALAGATARSVVQRGIFCVRETMGLLFGAFREHVGSFDSGRLWLPFSIRRFTMQREFRFPRSTAVLMTIILAGVVLAIEKGKAIQASLPHVNPQIGPIQPTQHYFLAAVALVFAFFYAAGLIGWAIVFALHRSGVHRLADMSAEQK